jgi:hypothetical protein
VVPVARSYAAIRLAADEYFPRRGANEGNVLNLNLDIYTRRKIQAHKHIYGFGVRVQNIDQTIMSADFEMFVRVFIDES